MPEISIEAYPDKACYRPGEPAVVNVELGNQTEQPFAGRLVAAVMHLAQKVAQVERPVEIAAQAERTAIELPLSLPDADFRGYGVEVTLLDAEGRRVGAVTTALDVLSDWSLAPRYGFFAEFAPGSDSDGGRRAAALAKCHINVVQFYDWMWRHYALLPPPGQDIFTDGMGRAVSLPAVKAKIAGCRRRNMAALAYGAVYGAEPEYFHAHRELALFNAEGKPEGIGELFYIMNIEPDSPWCDVIVNEYRAAVAGLGFDGIHMDQYGLPKFAHLGGADGPLVDVGAAFGPLIDRSAVAVREVNPSARVIFNNVGDWPTELTAPRDQAAVYIEVWPPHDTYADLQRLIEAGRAAAGGKKQVILAAYISPLAEAGQNSAELAAAEEAARLATAVIHANGGFHLLLGEQDGALCDPYYPRYAHLRPAAAATLRAYYDFVVRYENWLSDPMLARVADGAVGPGAMIELGSRTGELIYGAEPQPGGVWAIARSAPGTLALSLINLRGQRDTLWNAPRAEPRPLDDISLTLRLPGLLRGLYLASPDCDSGRARLLPFEMRNGQIECIIPHLDRWDLVIAEMDV